MSELIYNIKDIFGICLSDYGADNYHIAAYQRGYKWDSDNGAVVELMRDIYKAYTTKKKEYYLQYITLKKNDEDKHLEIIDGQQRLTTISIILAVISLNLNMKNISSGKLSYAVRKDDFIKYIYDKDDLKTLLDSGEAICSSQDMYYISKAAIFINKFIMDLSRNDKLRLYEFVIENVKLIVNVIGYISSEKVFSNLNTNKVELTQVELIKGILLTKISRQNCNGKRNFKEILDLRISLGREWDEMERWINQQDVKNFFFNDRNGMESLLKLVAIGKDNNTKLFEYYLQCNNIEDMYIELLRTYKTLYNWYYNDEIYNLLGYILHHKASKATISKYIIDAKQSSKSSFINQLKHEIIDLIPKDVEKLRFKEDDINIHKVLLALSVFPIADELHRRFNYFLYSDQKWSLEHIFSQSPEGRNKHLEDRDIEDLKDILEDKATIDIIELLKKEERTSEDKEVIKNVLQSSEHLNSIGNLCLLTQPDNSSNGCLLFREKRVNILKLIQKGSFIPKHTFEIFSKMLLGETASELMRWTKNDIISHCEIISSNIENIKLNLSK